MRDMKIDEIAKLAEVSKATVSRVLNNKPDVNPDTRRRIIELIRKFDYKPNAMATAVSKRRSKTIGLIAPHGTEYIYTNPFYSQVFHGMSNEINRRGYYLMFCYAGREDYTDLFQRKMVEGFLLLSPGMEHQPLIDSLKAAGAPFVATSLIPGLPDSQCIDIDNFQGACLAVEHLIELGHRRIAIVNSFSSLLANKLRFAGYQSVLHKHGIPLDDDLIREGVPSFENGLLAIASFDPPPTAVFSCGDMLALGVLEGARRRGLRVPEDLSVVGFDDISFAGDFGITTVRQPGMDKGKFAARALIDLIEGRPAKAAPKLEIELVVRNSTSQPAKR